MRFNTNSTRVITYVLLCGYSPFRSDDVKALIKETTEAKIDFHERYWQNVSTLGTPEFFFTNLFYSSGIQPKISSRLYSTQIRRSGFQLKRP